MAITWTPEREGNWLFHCHIMRHVSPSHRLDAAGDHAEQGDSGHAHHSGADDASAGMAGMILGVTVVGPAAAKAGIGSGASAPSPRRLTLTMQRGPSPDPERPSAGLILSEGAAPPVPQEIASPGPALVLKRNQPVEITLVNNLPEPTAMHWHGIELDSYYDGVHGWSGAGQQLAPMIEPGGRFVVRFTPPRAGTFIYHTHLHDFRQLSSGLYGPLIVTGEDDTFDPATDHVMVIGRRGITADIESILNDPSTTLLNGERSPRFTWKAGQRHRVRLINITPDDIFVVGLQSANAAAA